MEEDDEDCISENQINNIESSILKAAKTFGNSSLSFLQESNQTQNNVTSENPSVFLRLRTVNEMADYISEYSIADSS
jgi:hypothetical protein